MMQAPLPSPQTVRGRIGTGVEAVALLLLWSGLAAGAVSVVATHPRFSIGVWGDAEGCDLLFHAAAGLCFAGMAMLVLARPAALRHCLHPAAWLSLCLGLWGLAGAGFADFPGSAVIGAPQNGEGALWFLAQGIFIAAAMALKERRFLFGSVVVLAAGAAVLAAFFDLSHIPFLHDQSWLAPVLRRDTMLRFNEYLAYFALPLFALGAVRLRVGGGGRWQGVLLVLAALLVLVVSRNRTAMVAVAAAVPLAAAAWPAIARRLPRCPRPALLLAVVSLLVPLLPWLVIRFGNLPAAAVSLFSRSVLFKVLEPSLAEPPLALLTGHGFGHYHEYLLRNLPAAGVSLVGSEWSDLYRDLFHCHHALLEVLFAAGLPGMVLLACLPFAVVAGSRRALRPIAAGFALAWAGLDAMWFMMPVTMVALALAVAALGAPRPVPSLNRMRPLNRMGLPIAFGFLVLGGLAFAAASAEWHYARGMDALKACLKAPPGPVGCVVPADPRGSGLGLAATINTGFAAVPSDEQARLLAPVLEEARRQTEAGGSVALGMAVANAYSTMADTSGPASPMFHDAYWQSVLLRIVEKAPRRLDVLAGYLNWLLAQGRSDDMRAMLERAAMVDKAHPIVSWYSGFLLLDAPAEAARLQGLSMMRQALAGGVERFMTVDPSITAALAGTRPAP